jgi:hypothetical protein
LHSRTPGRGRTHLAVAVFWPLFSEFLEVFPANRHGDYFILNPGPRFPTLALLRVSRQSHVAPESIARFAPAFESRFALFLIN